MRAIKYSLNDEHGVYIEERGPGSWAVVHGGICMSKSGRWSYEPLSSSRTDEWKAEHLFPSPEEAHNAWLLNKHLIRFNGVSL